MPETIWLYWEGAQPAYIALCCKTVLAHNHHDLGQYAEGIPVRQEAVAERVARLREIARGGEAIAQRADPVDCCVEVARVELPAVERGCQRCRDGLALTGILRRAEDEIHPRPSGEHCALPRVAESVQRARLERVGDRHALKAELSAQLALDDRLGESGRVGGIERRVARPGQHNKLDPDVDRRRIGCLVDVAQIGQRDIERDRPSIGVLFGVGRTQPREMLGSRCHTGALLSGDEGRATVGHRLRALAVRALVLIGEVARLAVDIEHRREVDVHADATEVLAGRCAGLLRGRDRISSLSDLLLRPFWCAGQPPHKPTLLIGHQEQRRLDRAILLRLAELTRDSGHLSDAGDIFTEEDHPGGLAGSDRLQQRVRHR